MASQYNPLAETTVCAKQKQSADGEAACQLRTKLGADAKEKTCDPTPSVLQMRPTADRGYEARSASTTA